MLANVSLVQVSDGDQVGVGSLPSVAKRRTVIGLFIHKVNGEDQR